MKSEEESAEAESIGASEPPVTVVIAVPGFDLPAMDIPGVPEIVRQAAAAGGETLAVRSDRIGGRVTIGAERLLAEGAEKADIRTPPPGCLTPHLWQAGIDLAEGRIVVLTLAGLRPADGWLKAHLDAHATGHLAAVGGPIEADPLASSVDRAIAVSRYSSFLLPFEAHEVHDVAADNASYRRDAIEACRDLITDGFWEPPVHARMRGLGLSLLLSPEPAMVHSASTGCMAFIRQRLSHGFRFGRDRRAEVSPGWMVKYFLFCPVLPILLLARVVARWRARGRPLTRLLPLLPFLLCFNLAWAAGEIGGTIPPARRIEKSTEESEET